MIGGAMDTSPSAGDNLRMGRNTEYAMVMMAVGGLIVFLLSRECTRRENAQVVYERRGDDPPAARRGNDLSEPVHTAVAADQATRVRPAPEATSRLRALAERLNGHADWREVAAMYTEEADIYSFTCSPRCARSQLEGWITSFYASGDRVEFSECRALIWTPDDRLTTCDGTLTHNGARIAAHECFGWSVDGLVAMRQNAPNPASSDGGCARFVSRVQ